MISFVNNQFIALQDASIPVSDLGLQRGYAIFDFLRVKGQQPLFLDAHIDRLFRSLERMRLTIGYSKEQLKAIISELINKNKLSYSGIRITVTGGASSDVYTPAEPHIIIVQQTITPPPDAFMVSPYKLATHAYRRQMPEVKSTDYLMAIWLQPWIQEQGAADVLYQWEGSITECPRANFFLVSPNNTLITPDNGMLKGITRANILSVAQTFMSVEERAVTLEDVRQAKEAFISSSTKRITPVTAVDDVLFTGYTEESVTARLFELLQKMEE